ncbi:hypothetical protein EDC04DRAFT_2905397 [Pisolithus marmoratus]|nr:hypothetical protein EDC04DRAFT_2905397 [Pisolithus marmoratus]
MFCDLGEVTKVTLLLKEEDTENMDEDDSEVSKRHKSILKRVDGTTQDWYQRVYRYIRDHAPYAIELMKDKKQHNQFDALISESDDASHLKKVIGMYAMPYPDKKNLEPPLGPNESHS